MKEQHEHEDVEVKVLGMTRNGALLRFVKDMAGDESEKCGVFGPLGSSVVGPDSMGIWGPFLHLRCTDWSLSLRGASYQN